jgi:AcrR family transcriptional regulator
MDLRESNREERRQRILRAARVLIEADGAASLSMRRLAAEAGLAVATLYNLFGSKEEIRSAWGGDLLDGVDAELNDTPLEQPLARARAVIHVGVAHIVREAAVTRPALLAGHFAPFDGDECAVSLRAAEMQRVALVEAVAQGLLRDDVRPDLLAAQIYEGFNAAQMSWAQGRIDGEGFLNKALYSLTVCLLAAATDATRPQLIAELREIEPRLETLRTPAFDRQREAS